MKCVCLNMVTVHIVVWQPPLRKRAWANIGLLTAVYEYRRVVRVACIIITSDNASERHDSSHSVRHSDGDLPSYLLRDCRPSARCRGLDSVHQVHRMWQKVTSYLVKRQWILRTCYCSIRLIISVCFVRSCSRSKNSRISTINEIYSYTRTHC